MTFGNLLQVRLGGQTDLALSQTGKNTWSASCPQLDHPPTTAPRIQPVLGRTLEGRQVKGLMAPHACIALCNREWVMAYLHLYFLSCNIR